MSPIELHTITSRPEWLAMRKKDVTASAVGALTGRHDYLTAFALWGLKTGRIDEDPDESPAMQRGRLLEPVAVELLRETYRDWSFTRPNVYMRDPVIRLGATPDVFASDPARGLGIIQIKSVEPSVFRRKWRDAESGDVQPPLWILLQGLVEAHLAGAQWAAVAALTVGFGLDLHVVDIPLHAGAIDQVRQDVTAFWKLVASGDVPPIDYSLDARLIGKLYAEDDGDEIDLSGDQRFNELVALKDVTAQTKNAAEKALVPLNAEILARMGNHAVARFAGGRVSAKTIRRKAYAVEASTYRSPRISHDRKKDTDE